MSDSPSTDRERWAELRRRAEAALDRNGSADDTEQPVSEETRQLLQELRIAQVELEIQNEELRRAQQSLEESRSRYETLFDRAPVGYAVLDRIGIIQQVNESLCQMLGRSAEQLKQRALRSFVIADQQASFDRRFPALLHWRAPRVIETRLAHQQSGRALDVRLEGTLIDRIPGDRGGEESGSQRLLVAVSDVTVSKSLEQQLWESQKLETVGRLAGGIAHDFNNALTVIQGTVDVARLDLSSGSSQDEYLHQIESATARASALVQQLLMFAHKGVAVPRVVDMHEVLDPLQTMLRRLLPESVGLEWSVADDVHKVRIDPVQIDQVLTNLVLNARDAVGDGGTIRVTCENSTLDERACLPNPHAMPGEFVAITVADDGSGMDAATRERAFEPFFTTKPLGKGSGLGLSTVYGIAAQNRGLVDLATAPGEGTTFTVYLPRSEGQAARTRSGPRTDDRLRGQERVLVVEDNLQILNLTKRLLLRKGYQVEAFDHPEQALAWFEQNADRVDLVLSDVVMPDLSGPAMVDRLLALRPDLPYAFMSGYPKNEVSSHLLEDGTVFIHKPFDSVTLLGAIREVLDTPGS
jgi:PAS domain S-box-containing protein